MPQSLHPSEGCGTCGNNSTITYHCLFPGCPWLRCDLCGSVSSRPMITGQSQRTYRPSKDDRI